MEGRERSYVLAATAWKSNAHLILDCARLGYLRPEWDTLDATYGEGNWWTLWRPEYLVTNDWNVEKPARYHEDFRSMHWADASFNAVTYDPPYIAPGGRDKSTIGDFNGRFGLHDTPATPAALQEYMNAGLRECARVVKPKGYVLAKCTSYVNGAKYWPGVFLTWEAARELRLELVADMKHLSGTGPQSQESQEHPRSNLSTLLVFKKSVRAASAHPKVDALAGMIHRDAVLNPLISRKEETDVQS